MANILERYGIKEVADVTFYDINSDGTRGAAVLYLDTLKVSTIEQTAEEAEARGGKGNPPLIIWDYGKEITVTLEDALFSAKSLAIMFGDSTLSSATKITKTITFKGKTVPINIELPGGKVVAVPDDAKVYDAKGVEKGTKKTLTDSTASTTLTAGETYFLVSELTVDGQEIEISANSFPGTYYVTGDTYARSEVTGKDEFFQFIIQKAKVQSENTITLEAEGDPSVFNMNLRVMRPSDGKMMKLVKYSITGATEDTQV